MGYLFVQTLLIGVIWLIYAIAVIATVVFVLSVVITIGDMALFCFRESQAVHTATPKIKRETRPRANLTNEGAVDWWLRLASVIEKRT